MNFVSLFLPTLDNALNARSVGPLSNHKAEVGCECICVGAFAYSLAYPASRSRSFLRPYVLRPCKNRNGRRCGNVPSRGGRAVEVHLCSDFLSSSNGTNENLWPPFLCRHVSGDLFGPPKGEKMRKPRAGRTGPTAIPASQKWKRAMHRLPAVHAVCILPG